MAFPPEDDPRSTQYYEFVDSVVEKLLHLEPQQSPDECKEYEWI